MRSRRTGYVPNLLAGGLASTRSRLVAAVVPTISGPVFLRDGPVADRRARRARLPADARPVAATPATREDALLGAIIGRRPDGIVLDRHPAFGRRPQAPAGGRHPGRRDLGPDADADRHAGRLLPRGGRPRGRRLPARARAGAGWRSWPAATSARGGASDAFEAPPRALGLDAVRAVVVPAPTTLRSGRAALAELLQRGAGPRRRLLQLRPARARRA